MIHVRRSVGRTRSGREEEWPKSEAGVRSVPLDPEVVPTLREHLETYSAPGRKGWVFPAGTNLKSNVSPDVLRESFEAARHDLAATISCSITCAASGRFGQLWPERR